ncbi:hypothetical protein [Absidia glauca]|uniref:MARVEL domain-containing protein n=1 Tax=Absidia glauca TaxID=4829 RepID=A0A168KJS6_ABSGL|nr:hypothetical protein [Absidia glauca]
MGIGSALEAPFNVPDTMPWLSCAKTSSHLAQFVMTFLTACVVAPLIATENKYYVRFKCLGKFAMQPRANIVFATFYSLIWALCGIAMTAHANNPAHCTLDFKLQKQYGDDYAKAWINQCNLSKAGAAFAWLTCVTWAGGWICTMILFWNDKQLIQQSIRENKQSRCSELAEDPFESRDQGGMQSSQHAGSSCITPPPMLYHQQTMSSALDTPPHHL